MYTNKLGMVTHLDNDVVEYYYEVAVACLDEGVVACLDKNNKDVFYVDFLPAHSL